MGLFFNKYKMIEYGRLTDHEEQVRRAEIFNCTRTMCNGTLFIDENNGLFYVFRPSDYFRTAIAKIQNVTSIHSDYVYDSGNDGPSSFDYGRIIFDLKDEEFAYLGCRIDSDDKFFNFSARKEYEKAVRSTMDEVCAFFKMKEGKATKTTY